MSSFYEKNQPENTFYQQSASNQPVLYQSFSGQGRPLTEKRDEPYLQQRQPGQLRRVPPMPKTQAQEIVERFKRWIVVATLVSFGSLGVLILGNIPATKSSQVTPASSQSNPNSSTPSSTSSSDSSSGGIFQSQQGGFGFGSSNTNQGPVSHSSGS